MLDSKERLLYLDGMTYASLRARAQRSGDRLVHAREHLRNSLPWDFTELTYTDERAVMDACALLDAAHAALWHDADVAKKHEGIGTYMPYGRR